MAKTTSFLLGEHFEELLQSKVASGRYATASEVVREALRLLELQDRQREELEEALRVGEESGGEIPHDEAWAFLEAKHPWLKG